MDEVVSKWIPSMCIASENYVGESRLTQEFFSDTVVPLKKHKNHIGAKLVVRFELRQTNRRMISICRCV